MLHIAKVKANEQEFDIIYEQAGLKAIFKQVFFNVRYYLKFLYFIHD
jgi:hypothetical protein